MKKIITLFTLGLIALMITACGEKESTKPVDVVTSFLENIQAGDLDKAGTYVFTENENFDFSGINEDKEDPAAAALINGISNNYQFKKPVEKNIDDNNAEVTVEVTSIDFAAAMETFMGNMIKVVFDLQKEDLTEQEYEKTLEDKTPQILSDAMSAKDAKMITRNVTLTLTKDDEGNFKIVSDEQLKEAVLGNAAEVEELYSGF